MSARGLLQDGSLNIALRKRLNTTPGADTLAPEIMPVFVVEGELPDHQFLKGVKLCTGAGEVTAVAGQLSFFQLRNPIGSNLVFTVTRARWTYSAGVTFWCFLYNQTGQSGSGATETTRDTRWAPLGSLTGRPRGILTVGTQVAPFSVNDLVGQFAKTNVTDEIVHECELVLAPGTVLTVFLETANVAIDAFTIDWNERPANPSELV